GVPPAADLEPVARVQLGPHVAAALRDVRERGQYIQHRDAAGRVLEAGHVRRDLAAQLGEQARLELGNALLGAEHLGLPLLQLGGDVALAVRQRLFALVIGRDAVQIGARHFQVVTEYLVVAYLERCDAGALTLPRLERRDELLAAVPRVAELIQLGVVARADRAAVGQRRGRI